MNRKSFDKIASTIGLLLAVVLILAGALLRWGGTFATSQVRDQLVSQTITFPEVGSDSLKALPEANRVAMEKYAGQQMTTGDQAYTYANNYIKIHMAAIGGGKSYEEISGEFMGKNAQLQANPNDASLQAVVAALGQQRQTMFMGNTLVGLLGFTYAFGTIGKIALIASWTAVAAGALFLVLALAGFSHLRKEDEIAST
jgi:hypothetical protein